MLVKLICDGSRIPSVERKKWIDQCRYMMASGGNYSFFNHNLGASAMNQAFDRPKLLRHRHSAENRLDLGSSSPCERDQPVKEITVQERSEHSVQFVPHPPSSPRSNAVDNRRIASLNSKGKKRSRYESPRTSPSGSEDEKRNHKHAHNAKLEPLPLQLQRRGSNSSLDSLGSTESLSGRTNRNLKGIEPLKDIGTDKELVGSFKSHQSKAKSEVLSKKGLKHNVVRPLRVTNEPAELDGDSVTQSQSTPNKLNSDQPPVLNNATSTDDEVTLSSSNDSLTSVSGSEENVSSDGDQESRLEKRALNRDPNSTLPTIPKHVTYRTIEANSSGLYESIVTSGNNGKGVEQNSASDLKNLSKALAKVATEDGMYVSDTELSVRSSGQVSNVSNLSVLPRLPARTARSRSGNFLKEEMKRYFPDRKIGVFVATWNMHEEKEVPFYLDDFLIPDSTDFLQDLYVIGLQESTSLRKEWEIRLQETLGPSHVLMHSGSFGLLHLSVFIRKELVWFCSALKEDSVATRLGHMIKTKGALAISFSIFGTSFLFINSHFTSDEGKAMDRVNDYKTICRSLSLSPENQANLNSDSDVTANFDRIFWLGDLNFRVGLERSKVDELLMKYKDQENPECLDLLEKDELLGLMQQGKLFLGFSEPPIRFLPSYKHDIQSDEYDSSPKNRVPSWTDRVLYRCKESSSIIPVVYNSCVSVKTSDHRPVFGVYEVILNPCRENVPLTGGQYIRDVYIEANRRRASGPRSQEQSSVCVIL